MSSKYQVIIMHGSYGTPDGNWFPWLSEELKSKNIKPIRPKLPTPEGQNLDNWLEEFYNQIKSINNQTILIGHSLSPAFILHLLQKDDIKIMGTFLVAPFVRLLNLPDFDKVNESFVIGDFNWAKIKNNAGIVKIYASDNDPYVPFEATEEISEKLGVNITIIKGAGHINQSSGYTKFNELRDDLFNLLKLK